MNRMKIEQKDKVQYKRKINMHVLTVWCMCSTFLYGDFVGPLKMCHCNDYLEKFIEHMEDEAK